MIRVTTVCGEKHLIEIESNKYYSNAEEFANLLFSDTGVVRITYVISTTGVIISAKHIVTVENVKE